VNYTTPTASIISPLQGGLITSGGSMNFFPTMSVNQAKGVIDIAGMQTDVQKTKLHVQYEQRNIDNLALTISPSSIGTSSLAPNWSEPADNFFPNGEFIGDYFQIKTLPSATTGASETYIGFNANTRSSTIQPYNVNYGFGNYWIKLGGNQDDNYIWTADY
jgi:hypothetical protein